MLTIMRREYITYGSGLMRNFISERLLFNDDSIIEGVLKN